MSQAKDLSSLRHNEDNGYSSALFIQNGAPTKGEKNQPIKRDNSVEHLLHFDLQFNSLKTYLEGVTTVINQHANIINQLETDVSLRLPEINLYEVVNKLGSSSHIKDKSVAGLLAPFQPKPLPENSGKKNDDVVNSFCNKLELFTHGFAHFNKINATFVQRFDKVEAQFHQKVNVEDFKTKVKKTKTKLRSKMDENHKILEDKIKLLEDKLSKRIDEVDTKRARFEQLTNSKLQDGLKLLEERANRQYVDDAIRLLEDRMRNEITKQNLGSMENFDKNMKELSQRLTKCEDQLEDKVSSIKKNIKEIETIIFKKMETNKFEEFKKEILARIDVDSEKVRNLSKKCDPTIDTLGANLTKAIDDINKLKLQIKSMNEEIETLTIKASAMPVKVVSSGDSTNVGSAELAALKSEMDSLFAKFRADLNKVKESIKSVEDSMHSKVDFSVFNTQIVKKMDIIDFERQMNNIQLELEKLRLKIQGNDELQNALSKMEDSIDKKLAKLRKELDINNLMKLLKTKAEDENVAKGFENTDKKITAISETLLALRKEFDRDSMTIKRLVEETFSISNDASLTVKKMNMNCLSCGNFSKIHNPIHTLPGIDGKMYQTDQNQSSNIHLVQESMNTSQLPSEKKNLGFDYTYSQTVTVNRVRPQTATGRGKIFKNTTTTTTSPIPVGIIADSKHVSFMRPGSAKK